MTKTLTEKIDALSEEDRATFNLIEALPKDKIRLMNKEVLNRAYTRHWCNEKGIDYVNPDLLQIAIYTYRELIAENKI